MDKGGTLGGANASAGKSDQYHPCNELAAELAGVTVKAPVKKTAPKRVSGDKKPAARKPRAKKTETTTEEK